MDKANYKNGNAKYPVSTDTLDFIQKQIELIYHLSDLFGKNYILMASTTSTDGIIVVNGEVMPLKAGASAGYVSIRETSQSITAVGVTYENARIIRYAEYVVVNEGDNCYEASLFVPLKTISALKADLDDAKKHLMPTGSIIMWSGTVANIPAGFALCNGSNGTPNLSGRFIVGIGVAFNEPVNYDLGDTGGKSFHKLSAAESGMPSHAHQIADKYRQTTSGVGSGTRVASGDGEAVNSSPVSTSLTPGVSASASHENRPPFYALAYIMKLI